MLTDPESLERDRERRVLRLAGELSLSKPVTLLVFGGIAAGLVLLVIWIVSRLQR